MRRQHNRKSVEFVGEIGADGRVSVPPAVLEQFPTGQRSKLRVRLTGSHLSNDLAGRGVTEDEVERIALTQLEDRDQVIQFLLSEGILSGAKAFRKRSGT